MSYRVAGVLGLLAVATVAAAPADPPSKVDLGPEFRKFGLTPLQQGDRADCSLFAMTALAEFEQAKSAPSEVKRLSEEFLIWAAHAASATKAGDQAMFYEAAHGLNVHGICTSKLMPYAHSGAPSASRPAEHWSMPGHAASAGRFTGSSAGTSRPASAPVSWRRSSRHWRTAIR